MFRCLRAAGLVSRVGFLLLGFSGRDAWAAAGPAPAVPFEDEGVWRIYRTADGLQPGPGTALSIGQRNGALWVVHGGGSGVSVLDGYSIRTLASGPGGNFGVYENRSGQIWSLHPDGVQEYLRDEWVVHPVEAVRMERELQPLRMLRPPPLMPLDRDRLLLLLPEQLVRYDAGQRRAVVLAPPVAGGMAIGRFNDFGATRDGGTWVLGSTGIAVTATALKRLAADSHWEVHAAPAEPGAVLAGRGFEDEEGGVVTVLETEGERRYVCRFDGRQWQPLLPAPDGLRSAWSGGEGTFWGTTRTGLVRWRGAAWEPVRVPGLVAAQFMGVAVEASGVFWLATSEGVVRRAPALWRGLSEENVGPGPVQAMAETADGSLWFAGPEGLTRWVDGAGHRLAWPAGVEPARPLRVHVAGGKPVILAAQGGLLVADGAAGRIEMVAPAPGRKVLGVLGARRDGSVMLQTAPGGAELEWRLESFDGSRFEAEFERPGALWELGEELRVFLEGRTRVQWLGTSQGLGLWNERSRTFVRVAGTPFAGVDSLLELPGGQLLCGSAGRLYRGDGRTWTLLRSLPAPTFRPLTLRDGSVWVLGQRPVLRYAGGSWQQHDPLAGTGVRTHQVWDMWMDLRGGLWAATDLGPRLFHREVDADPPRSQVVSPAGRHEFSTRQEVRLQVRVRDRWDYTPPELLVLSRRLNGESWSPYEPASTILMTNMPAGPHRLEVRAMDPSQNEEPEPAVFEFQVFLPWYAEPRIVGVGLAGAMVAAVLAWLAVSQHLRLRRSYAEVERIVDQRTQELERANQELFHSQKMRALGTLAAGIAHDFNSILSIIQGSAQIIDSNLADPDKIRTRTARIRKMVEQGSGIVKTMLGLSRSSKQAWREVEPTALLEEVATMVAEQLPPGIAIAWEAAPDLPRVPLAIDLIRQMFLNLIFNAADAMTAPGVVRLRAGRVGPLPPALVLAPGRPGACLPIEIIDTGHGIAADHLPRVFEPFFTTKALSTRHGTGLGLTMVYEIARETGCGLGVQSVLEKGTTFTVFIPLAPPGIAAA